MLVYDKKPRKYITFSVPMAKEVIRIGKNGEEITKILSYRVQFIDNARFMEVSLSGRLNNIADRIHWIKCNNEHDNTKCEAFGIKLKDCECCIEYMRVKDD